MNEYKVFGTFTTVRKYLVMVNADTEDEAKEAAMRIISDKYEATWKVEADTKISEVKEGPE